MSFHFGSKQFHNCLSLGNELSEAQRKFSDEFDSAFENIDPWMFGGGSKDEQDEFYALLKKLQTSVFVGYNVRKAKRAVESFVQKESREGNFFDAMRFAATYRRVSAAVGVALDSFQMPYSDDGFNDLCDSLPLGGRKVIEHILRGNVRSEKDLKEIVSSVVVGREAEENQRFILHGENYIRMTLKDTLQRSFTWAANEWVAEDAEEDKEVEEEEKEWFE